MVGGERRYHASGFRSLPDSNISAWFSILRISNDTSPDVDFSGVGIAVPRRGGDGRFNAVGTGLGCPSPVPRD